MTRLIRPSRWFLGKNLNKILPGWKKQIKASNRRNLIFLSNDRFCRKKHNSEIIPVLIRRKKTSNPFTRKPRLYTYILDYYWIQLNCVPKKKGQKNRYYRPLNDSVVWIEHIRTHRLPFARFPNSNKLLFFSRLFIRNIENDMTSVAHSTRSPNQLGGKSQLILDGFRL